MTKFWNFLFSFQLKNYHCFEILLSNNLVKRDPSDIEKPVNIRKQQRLGFIESVHEN